MNNTPDNIVQMELSLIQKRFGAENVAMHNGGTYQEGKLTSADIVLVTGFNNLFKGKGVGTEVLTALKNDIPAYLMAPRDNNGELIDDEDDIFPEDTFRIRGAKVYDSRDYTSKHYKLEVTADGVVELDELIAKQYSHRAKAGNSAKNFDYRDEPVDNEEFFL